MASFTLTPEEYEKIFGKPTPASVDTPNPASTPMSRGQVSTDTPPPTNANDSSQYEPGGSSNPKNIEIYNNTGEPFLGSRVTTINDANGQSHKEFVTPPDSPPPFHVPNVDPTPDEAAKGVELPLWQAIPEEGLNLLNGLDKSSGRVVAGAGVQAAKDVAGMGEYLLKKGGDVHSGNPLIDAPAHGINAVAQIADHLLGTGLSKGDIDYVDQNFPTMGGNSFEKLGMSIGAMGAEAVVGDKGARAAMEGLKLAPKAAAFLSQFFEKAKQVNPQNAEAATAALGKMLTYQQRIEQSGRGLGAAVGAATGANSNDESISQHVGLLPKQLPGLSPQETNKVGAVVDNIGLGLVLKGVNMLGSGARKGYSLLFAGAGKAKPINEALEAFQRLDPTLPKTTGTNPKPSVPHDEVKRRMGIFADVLNNNADVKLGFENLANDTLNLDTVATLKGVGAAKAGAAEYIRRANPQMEQALGPSAFNQWVDDMATRMINDAQAFKRSRLVSGSPDIALADARVNQQTEQILGQAADKYGSPEQAAAGARQMAQPIINDVNATREALGNAKRQMQAADQMHELNKRQNIIQSWILDSSLDNAAGSNNVVRDQKRNLAFNIMPGIIDNDAKKVQALYNGIKGAKDGGVPLDNMAWVRFLQQTGDLPDVFEIMGVPHNVAGKLGHIAEDEIDPATGEVTASAAQEIANQLNAMGVDLKTLYTKVRPELSARINQAKLNPNTNINTNALERVRNEINRLALSSGDPAYKEADDAYKRFMNKWKGTPELEQFMYASDPNHLHSVGTLDESGNPIMKGEPEQHQAALDALNAGLNDTEGEKLDRTVKAIGPDARGQMTDLLHGTGVNALARKSMGGLKPLEPEDITNTYHPYNEQIRNLNVASGDRRAEQYAGAIKSLQESKAAKIDTEAAAKQAEITAQNVENESKGHAINHFITSLDPSGRLLEFTHNPVKAFNDLFSHRENLGLVDKLLNDKEIANNPELKDGLKSQFLRFLKNKGFTNSPISSGVKDGSAQSVHDSAGAQLTKILSNKDGNNIMPMIDTIFKDDPVDAAAIKLALSALRSQHELRALRPGMMGSNTAYDLSLADDVTDRLITSTFGQLSHRGYVVRTLTKFLTRGNIDRQREAAMQIIDKLIANPHEFADLADQISGHFGNASRKLASYMQKFYDEAVVPTARGTMTNVNDTSQETDWQHYKPPTKADNVDSQTNQAFSANPQ